MIQSMGVREQQQQLLDAAAMVEGVARSLGNHGAVCRHCGLIRYDDLEVHREVQGLMEAAKKLPLNEKLAMLAKARFQPFAETLKKSAFTQLNEGQALDREAYLKGLAKDLGIETK